jgi:GntR family transcriptional repressor for pyruvate dehydrogenase complex
MTTGAVRPIQRTTLTAAAFDQLISHVVNGTWKAGDRIPPERELCQQLRIARTSLREALKAMELVGMLDSRVGDGTFVCPRTEFLARPLLWAFTGTDHSELHDIMEARMILEENLAGLAAERASDKHIAEIGLAVQAMRDCIARGESILEADMAFHMAVSRGAQNEVLTNAVQLLRNLMRQSLQYKLTIPNIHDEVLRRHASIYTAIRGRKPAAARLAMRRHLEETMHHVTSVMGLRSAEAPVKVRPRKAKRS